MLELKPRFENRPSAFLAGIRRYHLFANATADIPQQWLEFNELRKSANPTLSDVSYGLVCGSDDVGFEYMCAIEVPSFEGLDESVGRLKLYDHPYIVLNHTGHISTIKNTWNSVWQWLAASSYKSAHAPPFERYDERFNSVTGSGEVELWIPIEKD